MELAKGIIIPVVADMVFSPDVFYSADLTRIYFQTEDEQFGRITFENIEVFWENKLLMLIILTLLVFFTATFALPKLVRKKDCFMKL